MIYLFIAPSKSSSWPVSEYVSLKLIPDMLLKAFISPFVHTDWIKLADNNTRNQKMSKNSSLDGVNALSSAADEPYGT